MMDRNRGFSAALVTTIVLIVLAALTAALVGCAAGPEYTKAETAAAPQFAVAPEPGTPQPRGSQTLATAFYEAG